MASSMTPENPTTAEVALFLSDRFSVEYLHRASDTESILVSVGTVVPMAVKDHEEMFVVYRFHSIDHWGESVDKMVDNEEFQSLVAKGNELGTLKSTRIMSAI